MEAEERFSTRAKQAVVRASEYARKAGSEFIETEHVLYALMLEGTVTRARRCRCWGTNRSG